MKSFRTILLGILLIAVITPLSQLATIAMTNHDMETSAASGWVFGTLFSVVLIAAVLRMVAKKKGGEANRKQMVILFAMLSIAVPVMNLGVVRLLLLNLLPVQTHFLEYGVDTYRRAYQEQDTDWYPVVPTVEGLAYQKTEQLFSMLRDTALQSKQQNAYNDALIRLRSEVKRLERGGEVRVDEATAIISQALQDMGMGEMERFRQVVTRDEALLGLMEQLDLAKPMEVRYGALRGLSERAYTELTAQLPDLDEEVLYFVPSLQQEKLDRGSMNRLEKLQERLGPEHMAPILDRVQALEGETLSNLRGLVAQLGDKDLNQLKQERMQGYLEELRALDKDALAAVRTDFVYRLRTHERKELISRMEGGAIPAHDVAAIKEGVFRTSADQAREKEQGFGENLRTVWNRISWSIWRSPLLHWGGLALVMFLFIMCLAEWLRRKWVERENLAFPLVEVADHVIRHDFKMETAENLENPPPRGQIFAPVFWVGFALGAAFLLFEAFEYYSTGESVAAGWDLSKGILKEGAFKEMKRVLFVLSPILLGIFFLVNLEISFSVWSLFWIVNIVFLAIQKGSGGITDANYVGWASRSFPFEMEQMLGAGLAFGLLLLIKSFQGKRKGSDPKLKHDVYLPSKVMLAGLIGLPVVLFAMVADLGMTHVGMFVLFFGIWVLLGIASARLRSETGLPMQFVPYDFSRLPLMLGMSKTLGVKSFLNYGSLAVLPITMISRLLPQQLENLELGRRHQVKGSTLAISSLCAFLAALGIGLVSLVVMSHWLGEQVMGFGVKGQGQPGFSVLSYTMWVQHFFGEEGLEAFTDVHRTRLLFVGVGAAVFGALTILRSRFLRFPFHPIGYLLFLFSIFHAWLSPYYKGSGDINLEGVSWLWGSAFVAWLIKKLMIKYGGMNTYRAAKPAFIGLIIGALFMMFAINVVDLSVSARGQREGHKPSDFEKLFMEKPSYTPKVY
jgi:hypothetical protein